MYGSRIERWQDATGWALMVAAILFLIAYALQILANPTGALAVACEVTLYVTWAAFLVDYLVRLAIAEHRGTW